MILREFFTFLLITLLILSGSGFLFDDLYTKAQRNCHQRNSELAFEGKQGPPAPCLGD